MREDLANLLKERRGHFEFESGHHGDRWLDLETLCRNPRAVRPLAAELAARLTQYQVDVVCGPLVEGAFLGLLIASEIGVEFAYAERQVDPGPRGLYPVRYRLPPALRLVAGRRVAIVNDVMNAGSAVRATLSDLVDCSAKVVAIGTLLALGPSPAALAHEASIPLEALASERTMLWTPEDCPLCAGGERLVRHPGS